MSEGEHPHGDESRPQLQKRERDKGFDWRSGGVINPDGPLGKAVPGRPCHAVPVVLLRKKRGKAQFYAGIACFRSALELNARLVGEYVEAARYDTLSPEVEAAIGRMPHLSDRHLKEAVRLLTNLKSTRAYKRVIADAVTRDVRAKRHVADLARLMRVRRALEKGFQDVSSASEEIARFVRDNVDNNRRPGEAVLLRTVLRPSLLVPAEASAREIDVALSARTALRESSDVTTDQLALMAFHAQVNPAALYLDYGYLGDLLDLAVHAGRHALGFLEPLDEIDAATYRRMLCGVGQDAETDPNLRRERADLAAALRRVWVQVPGLEEATRRHGTLAASV